MATRKTVAAVFALVSVAGLAIWLARQDFLGDAVGSLGAEVGSVEGGVLPPRHTQAASGSANRSGGTVVASSPSLPLTRISHYRNPLWEKALKAENLEAAVMDLLNDTDPESVALALRIKRTCILYTANHLKLQEEIELLGWLDDADALSTMKTLRRGLALRCGKLSEVAFALTLIQEKNRQSLVRGGVFINLAPSWQYDKGLKPSEYEALDKVLRDPDYAALWIMQNQAEYSMFAETAGYFDGLNTIERRAVAWLSVCLLGGDCVGAGFARLHACLSGFLCKGNSVADSVASAVDPERFDLVTARANQLALATQQSGARMFGSPMHQPVKASVR